MEQITGGKCFKVALWAGPERKILAEPETQNTAKARAPSVFRTSLYKKARRVSKMDFSRFKMQHKI